MPPRTTRKYPSEKKTTTKEGYREYKKLQMRERRLLKKHEIVDKIYRVLSKIQVPELEQYRKDEYAKVDEWLANTEANIIKEGRAVVRGKEPFDVTQLVMNTLKATKRAQAIAEFGKSLINRDIDDAVKGLIAKTLDAATVDTDLYKAVHGDDAAERRFMLDLAKKLDRTPVEVTADQMPAELQKTIEDARSRIPSIQKMAEDQLRKWPGGWSSGGSSTVTTDNKYEGMSDSEIREAEKREAAKGLRKHRAHLLKAVEKAPEPAHPGSVANAMSECTLWYMEDKGVTREEAERWCKQHLEEFLGRTPKDEGAERRAALEADYDKSKVPRAEETFEELKKRKDAHWLEKKKKENKDSYVA